MRFCIKLFNIENMWLFFFVPYTRRKDCSEYCSKTCLQIKKRILCLQTKLHSWVGYSMSPAISNCNIKIRAYYPLNCILENVLFTLFKQPSEGYLKLLEFIFADDTFYVPAVVWTINHNHKQSHSCSHITSSWKQLLCTINGIHFIQYLTMVLTLKHTGSQN